MDQHQYRYNPADNEKKQTDQKKKKKKNTRGNLVCGKDSTSNKWGENI